ncbi:DUF4604 domain-containing protein [Sporobolomyces koalae]|uniref:DUF4604 domain-containing protein n=1 Tax=Sporobolomyces koalae TaxID=500713 RepID=UPI0031756208
MSKRARDPLDDPKSGPSKNQLRGLAYVGQKPAFLQNALAALAGGQRRQPPPFDANGRPAIPTRPEGAQSGSENEQDEDEWDLGKGDEAPTVVVLKEGKHLDREEVDKLRAQGSSTTSAADEPASKAKGSLSFSSGTASKSKAKDGPGSQESWDDVVKRSKSEADAKQQAKVQEEIDTAKRKDKDEKRKKKEKKEAKKKIGLLSFDE